MLIFIDGSIQKPSGTVVLGTNLSMTENADGILQIDSGSGGGTALTELTDVTLTSEATGEFLRKSAGDWVNTLLVAGDIPSHTHLEGDITDLQAYLLDITGEPLSTLSDVTITSIASGEILKWTGSAWINNTLAEAGISDTGHTHLEVDITDLQSYLLDITGEPLSTLSDVTITSIASGEILKWTGSAWINNTLAEAGISDTGHTHTNFLTNDASDTMNVAANATTQLTIGEAFGGTTRGSLQHSTLRLSGENSSGVLRNFDITNAGDIVTFNGTGTGRGMDISLIPGGPNNRVVISGVASNEPHLVIFNDSATDSADFWHDGTDFNTDMQATADWNITGLTGIFKIDTAALQITSTFPKFRMTETDAATNKKEWDFVAIAGQFRFRSLTDALGASNIMTVDRSAGTPTVIDFPNGTLQSGGVDVLTATMTTNGDILYYNSGRQRLAKGTNGQLLALSGGVPIWQDEGAGGGFLTDDASDTMNVAANATTQLTIGEAFGGTTRGSLQHSTLRLSGENSISVLRNFDISHGGDVVTFNGTGTGRGMDISLIPGGPNNRVAISGVASNEPHLVIFNDIATDSADFWHDGTDFNTDMQATADWNITGLTGIFKIDTAALQITSTFPKFRMTETDASFNEEEWDFVAIAGQFRFRSLTNALSPTDIMTVDRSAGTPTVIDFPNGTLQTGGVDVLTATMTTNGDILYYNSGRQRLAKGTNGQVLGLTGGLPAWQNEGPGGNFLASDASDTMNVAANALTTLGIGESTTLRGSAQDSRIIMYAENTAGPTIKEFQITHNGDTVTFDGITDGVDIHLNAGTRIIFGGGKEFRIGDTGTHYAQFQHNVTNFDMTFNLTTDWNITGLSGVLKIDTAPLQLTSTFPKFRMTETDASTNKKEWDFVAIAGQFRFRSLTDALFASNIMTVDRIAGVATLIDFPNGTLQSGGTDVALEVMTTHGDLIWYNGGRDRLARGTDNQVLTMSGTNLNWEDPAQVGNFIASDASDTMNIEANATTQLIIGEAFGGTTRGILQHSQLRLSGEDTGSVLRNFDITNAGSVITFNGTGTGRGMDITFLPGGPDNAVNIIGVSGNTAHLVIYNDLGTDTADWSHDGADFNLAFVLTADYNITGLTGQIKSDATIAVINTLPTLRFSETGAAFNEKEWEIRMDSGVFALRSRTDAFGAGDDFITIDRNGLFANSLNIDNATTVNIFGATDVIINRQVNGATTFRVGESTTLRGDSQDGRIIIYGQNAGVIGGMIISHSGTNLQFTSTGGATNIQFIPDTRVDIVSGKRFRIRDSSNNDWGEWLHDGIDFKLAFTNTVDYDIDGLSGTLRVGGTAVSFYADPLTTNGDILYYNSGVQRLAKGTDGQVLELASGIPTWAPSGSGIANTVSTAAPSGSANQGDIWCRI